jgi:hypothetical protein
MRTFSVAVLLVFASSVAVAQTPGGQRLEYDRIIELSGVAPGGIAWDGTSLWAAQIFVESDDRVNRHIKIDTGSGAWVAVVTPWPLGPSNGDLAFDGEALLRVEEQLGTIWRVSRRGDTLSSFRSPDHRQNGDPNTWGITSAAGRLFVSTYRNTKAVYELDPHTGEVLRSFSLPTKTTLGIELVGRAILAADVFTSLLYRLDVESGRVLAVDTLPMFSPFGLAFDGKHLWVSGRKERNAEKTVIYRVLLPTVIHGGVPAELIDMSLSTRDDESEHGWLPSGLHADMMTGKGVGASRSGR